MSDTYISAELTRLVAARADGLCEYCLILEEDTFFGCEVDHITGEKHGGPTEAGNLAYACLFCNRHKGRERKGDILDIDSCPGASSGGPPNLTPQRTRLGRPAGSLVVAARIGEAHLR